MTGGTVADVLDAAADLLMPEGAWTQGEFHNEDGCHCLVGAIGKVIGKGKWPGSFAAEEWVERHWPTTDIDTAMDLEEWNDAPSRTQAEVIAKLREAANAARATSKEAQGNGGAGL